MSTLIETQKATHTPTLTPRLSVTVLNYNYAHFLPQCLDTILRQTFTDFEVILINDTSTDNSLEVIAPYLRDPRIRLVDHAVNRGYVPSLIEGCELSRGDYIAVISADDYSLDPMAFERACAVMDADPQICLCYSAWHEVDSTSHVRHTRKAADHDYVAEGITELKRLLLSSPVLHSGTFIRRSAYIAVGGYDRTLRYSVDTNMWLALCSVGKVAYINTPLYAYRAHTTNMSNSTGALWQATTEMFVGIDNALERFPDLPGKAGLRRLARQRALVAVPTLDIFAGRLRRGWYGYYLAFRHYPLLTFAQPRTLSLILRTLLGKRLFGVLQTGLHRLRTSARHETNA